MAALNDALAVATAIISVQRKQTSGGRSNGGQARGDSSNAENHSHAWSSVRQSAFEKSLS
jgi:hypothetical protein